MLSGVLVVEAPPEAEDAALGVDGEEARRVAAPGLAQDGELHLAVGAAVGVGGGDREEGRAGRHGLGDHGLVGVVPEPGRAVVDVLDADEEDGLGVAPARPLGRPDGELVVRLALVVEGGAADGDGAGVVVDGEALGLVAALDGVDQLVVLVAARAVGALGLDAGRV